MLLLGGLRGDRDLELGGLAGDARVDLRESLSLGFDVVDLAVEVDDVGLGAAGGDADALAGDLRGEDDVVEESLVDGGDGDTAGKGARDELFTWQLLWQKRSAGSEVSSEKSIRRRHFCQQCLRLKRKMVISR